MYIKNIIIAFFCISVLAGCGGSEMNSTSSVPGATKKINAKLVGSELQVSIATDDQQNPQVKYLTDKGLYFVVWEDWRDRNQATTDFPADQTKFAGSDIWGQFINPDGTDCGTPFAVTNRLAGNQTAPSVAYKPGDKLVVVWQDTVGSSSGGYVRYSSITSIPSSASCATSSPVISAPVQVGLTHFEQYDPNAVAANTTSFTIVGDATGGTDVTGGAVLVPYVYPRSIVITGTYPAENGDPSAGPATPVNIQDDGQGKLIGSGATGTVNYMTGNLEITLINEVDGGATAVFTVNYGSMSGTKSTMIESLLSRQSPKVNYDSVKDQFALTWVESRNIETYASVLCFGVAPFTWVTGDSTFLGYLYLNSSLVPKANPLVIAGPDVMRSEKTSSMKLVSIARSATVETYVYDFFTSINNPNLESDNTTPETLFIWEGIRNTATLTCTLDSATGTITSKFLTATKDDGKVHIYGIFDKELILSTVTKWIDFQNTANGTNPAIVIDSVSVPRKFLIVWEDLRGGANTKIFGQLINSGGGLYNDNRMLSFQDSAGAGTNDTVITNSRQTRPIASFDAVNQRYFVMWQDERNSSTSSANIDLYGQFINLDGSLSGANYSISSNPSNQLAPAIAYDPFFKRFLAVWKDARNITSGTTASDIYGQLFSIGQPQLTLLTSTMPQLQLIPAVHDFGALASGSTYTWSFVVKNTGDTDLKIDKITLLPATPFSIAPTNPATLAPGSSATYTVTFIPASSGTYNSSFTLTSDGGNQTVALSATGIGSVPLSITNPTSSAWPTASGSGAYSIQLIASGGYTPISWVMTGLPPELTRTTTTDTTVTYSGTDLTPGSYNIVATVTDGATPVNTSTRIYTLLVGSAISIATTPLSTWTQSIDYFTSPVHSLSSTGATGSVTWMLLTGSGSLPPGVTLGSDGIFSGLATSSGSYGFTVVATDSVAQSSQTPFSITINPTPVITTSSISSGVIGFAYNQQFDMTGGTTPIVWSQTGGLPPGMQFDAAKGIISGIPTSAGSYDLTLKVTDTAGSFSTKTFNLTVYPTFSIATPSTSAGSPPPAVVGAAYKSFTFKTNYGGSAPYSWLKSSGALPAGLVLNQDTGIMSGTPTAAGDYTFNLKVSDVNGAFTSKTFTISVLEASSIVKVQLYGQTNAVVTSDSALQIANLLGTPVGVNPSSAVQIRIDGLTSGETVNMAVSFISIPLNPVFYNVDGTQWTLLTPDSIINNTIFYKVKDRASTTDTDPLALRDSNPSSGVIEGVVVVGTAGTSSPGSTTIGSVSSSGGGKSGCFIATAAYGSYLDPHVMILRHFRDDVLLQNKVGALFVKLYYKYSPPIADFIAEHYSLRLIMRFALTPLIFVVKYPLVGAILFVFACAGVIRHKLVMKIQPKTVHS